MSFSAAHSSKSQAWCGIGVPRCSGAGLLNAAQQHARRYVARSCVRESPSSPEQSKVEKPSLDVKVNKQLPRDKVLEACLVTSAGMAVLGTGACFATPPLLRMVGSGIQSIAPDSLLHLPSLQDLGISLCAGVAVTCCRFALMQVWGDLRDSADAANEQVLCTEPVMQPADIVLVACLPAATEELLFRGAVVGNLGGTTGAVLLVSLIFGYLHVSGPRNYASGIFATLAGAAYGMVYISSASVLAAAVAHSVGNVSSASLWLAARSGVPKQPPEAPAPAEDEDVKQ